MCSRSTCLVDLLVADPAPAVARDLVAVGAGTPRRPPGCARSAIADAEDGQRHPALAEEPQQAPHAGARAVLVERLHRHVPRGEGLRADDLGQERLRRRVAVQHAVLAAFLVVEDELHGDARAARPARVRRRARRSRRGRGDSRVRRGFIDEAFAIAACGARRAYNAPHDRAQTRHRTQTHGPTDHARARHRAAARPAPASRITLCTATWASATRWCATPSPTPTAAATRRCSRARRSRPGRYRLVFAVGEYFAAPGVALPDPPFVDEVVLDFGVADAAAHYHVPLLVSPWSWSTYRGQLIAHGSLRRRLAAAADPLGAPDHGHRVDRRVVLLRVARQQPAAAQAPRRTRTTASAASCGRCTAAASTTCRSSASRPRSCRRRCTGSSGRRTRRGCRASRCSSSCTTRNAGRLHDRPGRRRPRAVAGGRRSASRCSSAAGCSTTSSASALGSRTSACSRSAMIAFFALVAWGLSHVFSGRAMFMQVGAMIGTIMACERASS